MNVLKKGNINVKDTAAVKLITQGKTQVLAAKQSGAMATSLINGSRAMAKAVLDIKPPKAKAKAAA
jgi:hypothetical protein